jgi:hypothetical protein
VNPGGGGGTLADIIDRVLDKGIVIDAWAAVSLLGIEILSIQAQVIVASVETYLKYAEAVSSVGLPAAETTPKKQIEVTAAEGAERARAGAARPPELEEKPRVPSQLPAEEQREAVPRASGARPAQQQAAQAAPPPSQKH